MRKKCFRMCVFGRILLSFPFISNYRPMFHYRILMGGEYFAGVFAFVHGFGRYGGQSCEAAKGLRI